MNPNAPRDPWSRLTAAARRATDDRDTSAPYGLATRIAALACGAERRPVWLFERFALRAVGVASLLAVLSVVANFSMLTGGEGGDEEALPVDEPVEMLLAD